MRSISGRGLALLVSALVVASAPACRSSGEQPDERHHGKPEPYVPLPPEGPQSIGYFLTVFDRSLAQWSKLKLESASTRDLRMLHGLEADMHKRAKERRAELVTTLESGSPLNRRIAAAALGFTHDPSALAPLLACLADPDPELAQKTLLALGVLALPETPLGGILQRLHDDRDPWTRNNAAFAVLAIARAGGTAPELAGACRVALADSEPGVRAQCASALGVLADEDAVPFLAELLYDPANLVALAAATALARIGREHPEKKGTVARALAGALDLVRADRRLHLLGALRWLAGMELGEDAGAWLQWAHDLP